MNFNWRFGLGVGISIYICNLIIEKYWPDFHKLYKAIFTAIFVGFFSVVIETFLIWLF